jgi:hypothetical protein
LQEADYSSISNTYRMGRMDRMGKIYPSTPKDTQQQILSLVMLFR